MDLSSSATIPKNTGLAAVRAIASANSCGPMPAVPGGGRSTRSCFQRRSFSIAELGAVRLCGRIDGAVLNLCYPADPTPRRRDRLRPWPHPRTDVPPGTRNRSVPYPNRIPPIKERFRNTSKSHHGLIEFRRPERPPHQSKRRTLLQRRPQSQP